MELFSGFHEPLWLLTLNALITPVLCSGHGVYPADTRIKAAMAVIKDSSHLPAIARMGKLPFPHSLSFHSLEENTHSPCQDPRETSYRRPNGMCNNLRNPFQGAVLDTESRMFSNVYLDGKSLPRIMSNDFQYLAGAREVSLKCFGEEENIDGDGTNKLATKLVWQFGQFLSHDISHMKPYDTGRTCCDNFNRSFPYEQLYKKDATCFPIAIPADDPFFNHTCMIFSRAYGVEVSGVREPINGVTSYIDASTVYGSDTDVSNTLRRGVLGRLKSDLVEGSQQLSTSDRFTCERRDFIKSPCPMSGDTRLNTQPGLGAMHTMFHLEHNRLASSLFQLNKFWDDETLFQESRKIVIAIVQKIVYEDYLPLLIGNDVMNSFNLNESYTYDDTVDTRALLEFNVAAFRFGHSLINTKFASRYLSEVFAVPVNMDGSYIGPVLFHMANGSSHEVNNLFTSQIRDRLFQGLTVPDMSPQPGPSLDLMAININRGRDTGIATYTVVRDACAKLLEGVEGVQNDHLPSCWADGVYRNEEDIDLFVGGVSETPLPGAIVGPTFACLLAIQFKRLKFGDRFFYEGHKPTGFTKEQLMYIKGTTLAALMCEIDVENTVQRDVFRPVSESNARVPCSTILRERDDAGNGLKGWKDPESEISLV